MATTTSTDRTTNRSRHQHYNSIVSQLHAESDVVAVEAQKQRAITERLNQLVKKRVSAVICLIVLTRLDGAPCQSVDRCQVADACLQHLLCCCLFFRLVIVVASLVLL